MLAAGDCYFAELAREQAGSAVGVVPAALDLAPEPEPGPQSLHDSPADSPLRGCVERVRRFFELEVREAAARAGLRSYVVDFVVLGDGSVRVGSPPPPAPGCRAPVLVRIGVGPQSTRRVKAEH